MKIKQFLILFLTLITSFIFVDKVNAEIVPTTNDYVQFDYNFDEVLIDSNMDIIDELITFINANNNKHNFDYIITLSKNVGNGVSSLFFGFINNGFNNFVMYNYTNSNRYFYQPFSVDGNWSDFCRYSAVLPLNDINIETFKSSLLDILNTEVDSYHQLTAQAYDNNFTNQKYVHNFNSLYNIPIYSTKPIKLGYYVHSSTGIKPYYVKINDVFYDFGDVIPTYKSMSKMTFKKEWNSADSGYDMKSIDIHTNKIGDINFRFQVDTWDDLNGDVPKLEDVNFWLYDKINDKKIKYNNLIIENFECEKIVPNALESICKGTFKHIDLDFAWQLATNEFYEFIYSFVFNNTTNYYIWWSDDSEIGDITYGITTNLLENYTKYKVPNNSTKAYILPKNINSFISNREIIFPTYYLENKAVDVKMYDYNFNNNIISKYYYQTGKKYGIDNEFSSFEYEYFKDNGVLPMITFKHNTLCMTQDFNVSYEDWLKQNDIIEGLKFTFTSLVFPPNIPIRIFKPELYTGFKESNCEKLNLYIYVPNDYYPVFNDKTSDNDLVIKDKDDNLIVIIDKDKQNDDYYDVEYSNFIEYFDNFVNDLSDTSYYFNSLFTSWHNQLPSTLRNFFIGMWFLLCLILGLVLGGWK